MQNYDVEVDEIQMEITFFSHSHLFSEVLQCPSSQGGKVKGFSNTHPLETQLKNVNPTSGPSYRKIHVKQTIFLENVLDTLKTVAHMDYFKDVFSKVTFRKSYTA